MSLFASVKGKFDFVYFVLIGILLSVQNPLPKGVHAWAQADRLSLSMNFLHTNNILEPSTHCLQTENGRVGCEFPLIPYVVAKISQFSQFENYLPFIYRNFVWCFWVLGLFVLSKIFQKYYEMERNSALFLSLLLHSSPILIFYGHNFLMDVPAYALVLTAFYYFIAFCRKPAFNTFAWTLFFSALASIVKISALLYFGSFMAAGFITALFLYKSLPRKYLWYVMFVVCCVFLYFFYYYNHFNYVKFNKDNWSMVFLSESRPLKSFEDIRLIVYGFNKWKLEIFTLPQWLLIIGVFVLGLYKLLRSRKMPFSTSIFKSPKTWFFVFYTPALSVLLVFLGYQYLDHDYYYIVPFFPLLFLFVGKSIPKEIGLLKLYPKISSVAIVLVPILLFLLGLSQTYKRSQTHYAKGNVDITTDITWLNNGNQILSDVGVPKDAKIFVLYEFSMNIHLVYFDRMGLIVTEEEMNRETPFLEEWIEDTKPNYFIFRNQFKENFFARRPEFKDLLTPVFQNQEYTLWKLDVDKFFAL